MFVKDFHACQLAGTQALVFIFAEPKPYANPSFLLLVTSPTLAQETQNLKIQGLPSGSKGALHFKWTWHMPIRLPDYFFFFGQPKMYLVNWVLNLKQPAGKLQLANTVATVPHSTGQFPLGHSWVWEVLWTFSLMAKHRFLKTAELSGGRSGE